MEFRHTEPFALVSSIFVQTGFVCGTFRLLLLLDWNCEIFAIGQHTYAYNTFEADVLRQSHAFPQKISIGVLFFCSFFVTIINVMVVIGG